jgi:dipeptidyl aminopeptidase/acylaminoacyl peptidase
VPSKPFGGTEEIAFAPDSRGLVFTARDAGKEEPWSTDFDLYYVPVDGSQQPQCLTDDNKAWDAQPIFSPDGRTLAYRAMTRAGCESDRFRIILRSWPEGQPRVLTESWDRSPWFVCWSADSKKIYAVAENLGNTALFAVDVKTGGVKTFVREGAVSSPGVAGNRILFGLDHFKSPVELYSIKPDGKDMRPITQINSKKVSAARMGDLEQFSFQGWNDEIVYGTVVKPVDFNPAKKYPVAFLIHGGPEWSWVNYFNYLWNPQVFAGAGYAVVMIDFHGSTGYGQAFTDAIKGDWGGKPLVDLQKGLAAALERYPWMDEDRVGALGPSYGGYMVNWIAGNWPDRFRCLVNHAGIFDSRASYYDTEELWFPEWELQGVPWMNPDGYEEHNPVNFVKNWKTPMLVIHGGNDFRVTSANGFSTFTALQRRGIPSKFLYFPDENHHVLKLQNSIMWHETVIGWLDQWLK